MPHESLSCPLGLVLLLLTSSGSVSLGYIGECVLAYQPNGQTFTLLPFSSVPIRSVRTTLLSFAYRLNEKVDTLTHVHTHANLL